MSILPYIAPYCAGKEETKRGWFMQFLPCKQNEVFLFRSRNVQTPKAWVRNAVLCMRRGEGYAMRSCECLK